MRAFNAAAFCRAGGSHVHGEGLAFAIGGELQTGLDTLPGQFRKVFHNSNFGHAGGQSLEQIVKRGAQPRETRLAGSQAPHGPSRVR